MPSSLHAAVALFARQHGVAADRQVRSLGVSLKQQNALVARGVWTRIHPGVLRDAGAPGSWEQQAMAATLLVPGAVAAVRAAARLHQLDGYVDFGGLEIIVPRNARRPREPGVSATWSQRMTAKDLHVVRGIRVTTVPVTLVHLAAAGHNIAQALDGALRDGFKPVWLRDNALRWKDHGVAGPTEVLRLLADRVDRRLPRSWFQRIAKDVFAADGIEIVEEWPVYDADGTLRAELDLAQVDLKVGVECQSWQHHGSPDAQYADAQRRRLLAELGWDIVDAWWRDLDHPQSVVAHLRRSLRLAQQRSRGSIEPSGSDVTARSGSAGAAGDPAGGSGRRGAL
ncbi:MAG: hypothetical protein JWM34_1996 [Ilumatobacteraceae bacterium]|nr:hypothetical protein [Ilumatobacteraceae bacterium]